MEHGASRLLYLIAFVRIRVLLFLGAVFPDIALVRLSGYGSHIAVIAQMAALFASSLHPHLALRFRHAVGCCFRVHLAVVLASYDGVINGFRSRLARFRHADGTLDFQRFTRCSCGPGCADRDRAVSLSLAAAQRVVRLVPVREVGEWWWFENSRAYLYYFFIVNDCQFVAGHADAWCRGIGQTAARFLCDAPFLIRRSSIFLDESHMLAFRISFFVEGSILAQDERWRRA